MPTNYREVLIDSGYYTAGELGLEPDRPMTSGDMLAKLFVLENTMVTDVEAVEFCNYYGIWDDLEGNSFLPEQTLTRLELEQSFDRFFQAMAVQYSGR